MKKLITFVFFAALAVSARCAPTTEEGRAIFTTRCAGCHGVNKVLTGPALSGVDQRHSIEWIMHFVQSSQTVVRSGDTAAVALFERFNKVVMPDHPDINAENIQSIVAYIKTEAEKDGSVKAPFVKPSRLHPAYTPMSLSDPFFGSYIGLVVLLVLVLLFAVHLKEYERNRTSA